MSPSLKIRTAHVVEAELLTRLAVRSKAHWGYSQAFLEACRTELTVDASRFGSGDSMCFVAADDDSICGFYVLERVSASVYELDALFVAPEVIGEGIGRQLVEHAAELLRESGVARMIIQGDPHATGFYLSLGAQQVGARESDSIPGRYLPLFELDVSNR